MSLPAHDSGSPFDGSRRQRVSQFDKKAAVFAVLKKGKNVTSVARELGVARKTIYSWIKGYKKAPSRNKEKAFKANYIKGKKHPKSYRFEFKNALLQEIVRNPHLSITDLSKKLKVGRHAVYNLLLELRLTTREEREAFKRLYVAPGRLFLDIKLSAARAVVNEKKPVTEVARTHGVSRKAVYAWVKRYKEEGRLTEKYVSGFNHPKAYTQGQEKIILNKVVRSPELSIHQLAEILSLSSHGVYNVLKRQGLTYKEARLAYASQRQALLPAFPKILNRVRLVLEQFIPTLAPAPPPRLAKALAAAGSRLFKPFLFSSLTTFIFSLGLISWVRLLGAVTFPSAIGLFFATIALFNGTIFFLYSMKYYLTLAIVLSFSQQETTQNIGQTTEGRKRNLLSWILGLGKGDVKSRQVGTTSQAVGLTPNLEHIVLKRKPYISVHIPFYNEKNVVRRALEAATNFDYPSTRSARSGQVQGGYEVILCDDSTDDTTLIIKNYIKNNCVAPRSFSGVGWTLTQAEVRPGVTLKHLHRTSRSGFKGGALKEALKHTNPKAEFISVFDADFVPYPDTLELFLKYFQVTAGTLRFTPAYSGQALDFKSRSTKHQAPNSKQYRNSNDLNSKEFDNWDLELDHSRRIAAVQGYQSHSAPGGASRDTVALRQSNIAAVQGYQWHVLNKSENWITRGIRSEYAGSYVIERSGCEIYSGLKMISGAVYMIRRDVLDEVGWETSITEDFQLTLKLYEKGYKVVYTPYIQAPAECVSTLKRLIRQRMRWAEGHSNNVRKMFVRLLVGKWEEAVSNSKLVSSNSDKKTQITNYHLPITKQRVFVPSPLTLSEKLEFLYLSPYYLQAFFFLIGTLSWLISETLFPARLPFWTSLWGWSLVLTNFISLPLMNAVGLFLEESEEKDYQGIASFIALSYIMVPFQAYASIKGLLKKEEGPWFRTPKTGRITDIIARGRFYRFISGILPGRAQPAIAETRVNSKSSIVNRFTNYGLPFTSKYLALSTANNQFNSFTIRTKKVKWVSKTTLAVFLILAILLNYLSFFTPAVVYAQSDPTIEQQLNIVNEEYLCQVGTGASPSCDGSGNPWPTDNSLGLVEVNPNEYKCAGSNCGSIYFSTVAKSTGASGNEFRKSGSLSMPASTTEYTVRIYGDSTTTGCTGGEQKTRAAIQLYNKTGSSVVTTLYTTYGSCYNPASVKRDIIVRVARVSIVQTDVTNITDTITQIEMGAAQDVVNQSYAESTAPKYYLLNKDNYSGTKNAYFEATMQGGQGGSSAGRIFMSGFETGDGIEWSEVVGTPVFQNTIKRSGDYAISTTSSNYVQYNPTAASLFYVRFGWRLIGVGGSPIGLRIYDSGTTRLELYIDSSNSNKITFSATSNGGGSVVGSVAAADTWYLIELKVQVGSGSTIELKVNGVSYGTASGGSTSATVNQFRFAGWVVSQYFDDVVFSSSDFPGDGKIVALQPNASGDEGTNNWSHKVWDLLFCNFTPANMYQVVDESPHESFEDCVGVSFTRDTYIRNANSADNQHLLFALEDASVGGIGANDTINDVWYRMWAKRGNGGGTTHAIRKKWGGSASSSSDCGLDTSGVLCSLQETGTRSVANVDSAQLGASRSSGGRTMYVETLWMMVDYTPQTTMKAKLQQCNEASCSWSDVTSGEITTTSTSWTRVRSSNIWDNLTDDYLLRMVVDIDGSYNPQGIANAKFIIDQTESSGITDLELVHSYNTKLYAISNSGYQDLDSSYEYVFGNFAGGNFSYYFEGTILTSAGTGYAKLKNITNNNEIDDDAGCGGDGSPTSEVSTTSTSFERKRSPELNSACDWPSEPSDIKTMGSLERNSGTGTTSLGGSWLIIQVSNLQIPENLLLMLPLVLFIPKIFAKKGFDLPVLNFGISNQARLERKRKRQFISYKGEIIDDG